MSFSNKLKKQIDIPVWESCRFAPGSSSSVSSTASADNSIYHISHGRYIYYLQAATTVAGGLSIGTGFWRYDTVSDTYQQLNFPPIAPATFSTMQFVGGHGYRGRVLSSTQNSITSAALTGQELETYDIRIIGGTGVGQHRVVTSVSDPIIVDSGTVSTSISTPELNISDSSKNWEINRWIGYQVRFIAAGGNSVVRKILYNSSITLYFSNTNKYAEEVDSYCPIVTIAGAAISIGTVGTQYQIESSTIFVDNPWTTQPDTTSRFLVHTGAIWLASGGTPYNLQYYDIAADVWYVRNSCNTVGPVTTAGSDGTIMNTGEIALIYDRGTAIGTQTSSIFQDLTQNWTVNYLSAQNYSIRIFSGIGQGQVRKIISNTSNTLTVSPSWTTTPDSTSLYIIDTLDSGTATSAANSNQTAVATNSTIMGNILTVGTMSSGAFYAGQTINGVGIMSSTSILTKMGACFTAGLTATIILSSGDTTGIVPGMVAVSVATTGATGSLGSDTRVLSTTTNTITLYTTVSTALANATIQFFTSYQSDAGATNSGNIITVGSTLGLFNGTVVTTFNGTGTLSANTYVVDIINSTTFSISSTPTVAFSGSVVVYATIFQTTIEKQISGIPGGAGKYYVWPSQIVSSTTITGTGIATLTDSTKSWPLNRWNSQSVRIISGTGLGQVRSIIGTNGNNTIAYTSAAGATSNGSVISVTSVSNLKIGMQVTITAGIGELPWGTTVLSINTGANTFNISTIPTTTLSGGATIVSGSNNNTLLITPAWTTVPNNTSTYVIHGDPDKLYLSFGGQTPTFIHNIESDTITESRMLDYGVVRGVSAQFSDQNAHAIASGAPVQPITYISGTSTAYLSSAGALSSGTLITVNSTSALSLGRPITVSAGVGTFAAGSYVSAINSTTTFTVSATPTVPLFGGASVVSGVASTIAYFGMGPFLTTSFSTSGGTVTITFTTYTGSTYSGTTTIPIGSLITTLGITTTGGYINGDYIVTASSAGSVSFSNTGTGTQVIAGIISGGNEFNVGAATAQIQGCVPTGYNSASITTTCCGAGFIAYTNATFGQLTTAGFLQHLAQPTTSCTITGSTATVNFTGTFFSPGNWVSVVNVTTIAGGSGSYNGVYQVTSSTNGLCSFTIPSNIPTGTASVQGTIQAATTTQWITTVNPHNFKAGMSVSHKGDMQYANTATNITANVYPVAILGTLNQYTYSTGLNYAGTQVIFTQTNLILVDASKNWVPNQWANCLISFNTSQGNGSGTNPQMNSINIISNTATQIFFTGFSTSPIQGVSRYVISMSPNSQNNSVLGSSDNGIAIGVQSATQIQDISKFWAMPTNITGLVAIGATNGASLITMSAVDGILPGMLIIATSGTCIASTSVISITVGSISGLNITLVGGTLTGTTGSTTFTFIATASSSGKTITLSGFTTQGLQVGMYLGVSSVDNIKTASGMIALPVAGALISNGGIVLTSITITAITSTTTFTISSTPTIPLLNANIFASFWFTNQWVGRKVRLTTGTGGLNYSESAILTSTTTGILTFTSTVAVADNATGYAIFQQPTRGVGTALLWNFGQNNYLNRANYLYQARGGSSTGFDRLNLQNDNWDFLTPTPNYEVLTTGAMYAYDGGDRIYFTPQVTQRVYYFDIDMQQIHGGSQYPYIAGVAINGNRMEIYTTADGLKYLWLNRHSFLECFKQLLSY